jgi:hypothetical protein
MPLNIRTYHDLTEPDASGLLQQVDRATQPGELRGWPMSGASVAVMSGKGGVGKSFVTAALGPRLRTARAGSRGYSTPTSTVPPRRGCWTRLVPR